MSVPNRISTTIPAAVIAQVLKSISDAQTALAPYLLNNVSVDDLKGVVKIGDKSQPFVQKAIDMAKANPKYVPAWTNIPESDKDFNGVFMPLNPVKIAVAQLLEKIDITQQEAGAESMDAANDFYKSVGNAQTKGDADAKVIYDELKSRYEAYSHKKAPKP